MKYTEVLFLTAVIGLAACSSKKQSKEAKPTSSQRNAPVTVTGFIVNKSEISNSIEIPGSLLPYESTELHPEVSGRVVALNIKEGSQVSKGTLLVKLFDGDLQAQLKKLQVQLSISEKTVQRQGELLKIGGISQQESDLSGLDVNNIKADIDVIRTAIEKTEIRAPFSGKLGLRNISIGAYVTPASVIATIQQVDQLKLEFTIPEKYTSYLTPGQPVTFTIEGNQKKYTARVIATENAITENSRSLRIRGAVTVKDRLLIPGSFAKVIMDFGKDNSALLVPSQAVIPGSRNKQVIQYTNGGAKFLIITTGIRDSSRVQVISGLEAGDTIVLTGLLSIKPDSKLKLTRISNGDKTAVVPAADTSSKVRRS